MTRTSGSSGAGHYELHCHAINLTALATLSWSTINAASVSIDNGVGAVPVAGSVTVSPKKSTTYTLTTTGIGGSTFATATVTINVPRRESVALIARSMLFQLANGEFLSPLREVFQCGGTLRATTAREEQRIASCGTSFRRQLGY